MTVSGKVLYFPAAKRLAECLKAGSPEPLDGSISQVG